jgi:hypothetical protein
MTRDATLSIELFGLADTLPDAGVDATVYALAWSWDHVARQHITITRAPSR